MFKFMIMAAAAVSLATPEAGLAADAPAQVAARPADLAVTIDFAPPLGRPLRYRLVKTNRSAGQDRTIEVDFTVRFDRIEGGYTMIVSYDILPAARGQAPDPAGALLSRPITVRLNEEGDIVAVERESEYWNGVSAAMETLVRTSGERDERAHAVARQLVANFRALPDAERIAMVTENFAPVLAASTVDLDSEPARATAQVSTVFGPMQAAIVVRLERVTPDAAHLRGVTEFAPDAFEGAIRAMSARLGEGASPPGRFRVVSVDFSEQMEVARATGLMRRYRIERMIEVEEDGVRQRAGPTMTVEMVTP
jgi:hypothetical protein